ncbi:hypothetical protein GCM10010869_05570 [Mesorhizobium tianshanense]|uniref:Uncharacterized protein n=1 Tax=Mesorhizobium tianshanense TaxID=39844 RepID=A0A562NLS1_9HYPH|nr:hypothetical protein [Mesorhizobium tianshanense]TWI33159.1 hypothetical protein IQ26_04160 [Mesorhizobium tianshanense]GLS34969.1 hypothetical protein GCM10010869_05570 [Mesorhizobium tianshanense]
MGALDPNVLRQLVSEAVREALASQPSTRPEVVSIATDSDLRRFVDRIVTLMDDPATAVQLRDGTIAFQLDPDRSDSPAVRSGSAPANKIAPLSGIVGEKIINGAEGKELVLGPDAVVTPIARDRARERGISLIRRQTC